MLRNSFVLSGLILLGISGAILHLRADAPRTEPIQGLRVHTPDTFVLSNAKIVVSPGRVIPKGTVVVRDGLIAAVGEVVIAPAGARVIDLQGKTLYPGLIDAYGETNIDASNGLGAPHWNSLITPQVAVADRYRPDVGTMEKFRSQGVTARLLAPPSGIFKGTSSVVLMNDESLTRAIVKRDVAHHLRLTVSRGRPRDQYPNSPMGAVALARQTMYDAQWYHQAWNAYRADRTLARPETNDALAALQSVVNGKLVIADAANELYFLRADQFAHEFSLNMIIRGSGREYRSLDAIQATGRPVIVPLNFPRPPSVGTAEAAINVDLDDLMHWDIAPENPARLEKAGVRIALTSQGLGDPNRFLGAIRKAVQRGLAPDAALRALTTVPAELYGVADRLGSIEVGKIANLVVTQGELFDEKGKVVETWVDGRRYEVVRAPSFDVRGTWSGSLAQGTEPPTPFTVKLEGRPGSISGTIRKVVPSSDDKPNPEKQPSDKDNAAKETPDKKDPDKKDPDKKDPDKQDDAKKEADKKEANKNEAKLQRLSAGDGQVSFTFDAKLFRADAEGIAQASFVIATPDAAPATWQGAITWPDSTRIDVTASRAEIPTESDAESKPGDEKKKAGDKNSPSSFPVNFPLGAFGRTSPPDQPKKVLFKNAMIWTSGPNGNIENGSLLIGEGKILAVGKDIEVPPDVLVIDAAGKHISAGIIDCHSHMGTDGGVNEATQAITAEVRIGDFIDANDIDIYRQLAGGVTVANVLHGSANPIGGQNQVIKLRWGALSEGLKFAEAPAGIKFALGENVKQSNWEGPGVGSRYPQSRMGVEQIILDEFTAARDYADRWNEWNRTHTGMPPRRDLELDAITEILDKRRWIHCHCYRQDEILALLRTMDGFGVKIATLQHILEGYKVADEMARRDVMGSSFSDWWAYKFEVIDAIPYNGALMHNAGVVVSFNSDDRELARHLNHEAAKAVKYGGVPPMEALKFVTLNPAKQLRIDQYVGSLEPGKHADLVVWSGSPLSAMSRCEQTWVDGRRYFSLDDDRIAREESRRRKATLVQKILASGESMRGSDESDGQQLDLWPREDEVCHPHDAF